MRSQPASPARLPRRAFRSASLALSVAGALAGLGCGHKGPVMPPPLMNPAPTRDLKIQQRGDELILEFTYPQTTVSGLPLPELTKVEYWELRKPVPEWSEESLVQEEEAEPEEGGGSEAEEGEGEVDRESRQEMDEDSDAGDEESGEQAPTAEPGAAAPEEGEETDAGAEPPESTDEGEPAEDEDDEAPAEEEKDEEPAAPPPPPPTKEQLIAVEVLEFDATAQIALTLEAAELDAAVVGDKIRLRRPFPETEGDEEIGFIYAIKTFSSDAQGSGLSNLATLVRREPQAAPAEFEVEAEAGGVKLSWFNPEADKDDEADEDGGENEDEGGEEPAAGGTEEGAEAGEDEADDSPEVLAYWIYRRDAQARLYGPPIGKVGADLDEYMDRTAQYGNRYIFALTAVSSYTPLVESALAGEIEVDYQDRFAPPAPRNLLAFSEPGRIRLLWDASPAPDLAGYIVFRRSPGEDFRRLTVEPILDLEYNDRDVEPATLYEYRVSAVDQVGNQGDPTPVVDTQTP